MAKRKYIKEVKKDVNIINDYPVFSTTGGTTITIYDYKDFNLHDYLYRHGITVIWI